MRVYTCPACQAPVYPEALACSCGAALFLDPLADELVTEGRACANREGIGCSWQPAEGEALCLSCAMTSVTPDLRIEENRTLFAEAEAAKRWALQGLLRLGWFRDPAEPRPEFHMVSEKVAGRRQPVTMGHADGLITLNVMESDPAVAVERQQEFEEPLRSMVGHVRHEVAHFLFDAIAARAPDFVPAFRALMGDESADYGAALQRYYAEGPSPDWPEHHISAYASAHPHEDWAETAAHVLHLWDLDHSAIALGLGGDGPTVLDRAQMAGIKLNHMNRSLGQPDPYPMIIAVPVREKLEFAEGWIARG